VLKKANTKQKQIASMSKRVIKLSNKEIAFLQTERKKRGTPPRKVNRINILLLSHEGKKDADVSTFLHTSRTTVLPSDADTLKKGWIGL